MNQNNSFSRVCTYHGKTTIVSRESTVDGKETIVVDGLDKKTFTDTKISLWSNGALEEKKVGHYIMDVHHHSKSILQLWVPPVVKKEQVTINGGTITFSDFYQLPTAHYKLFSISFECRPDKSCSGHTSSDEDERGYAVPVYGSTAEEKVDAIMRFLSDVLED